jgi:predicted DNA binding CopG/RHH family protein
MSAKQTPDLGDLIQNKGAPRPSDIPQRGGVGSTSTPADTQASTPAAEQATSASTSALAEPQPSAQPSTAKRAATAAEPRTKSLTLRLSESQYQRLRRFAFDRGASHQDVIEAALMEHLDKESA